MRAIGSRTAVAGVARSYTRFSRHAAGRTRPSMASQHRAQERGICESDAASNKRHNCCWVANADGIPELKR